ncbi:glycosyltransferase [Mycobacterium sp.]|uniref:glycosyltransferase n=1 Tax=Mycobacterium sp. TaxID=1785 RepID=UPI00334285BA|nr:glycosyltransferase WbuB [Mycobacterium sp.]
MSTKAPRKRIAVTFIGINYEPEPLGIAPYSTGLCNELADRGYDVKVITGVPHYPEWRIAPEYQWKWTSFETIAGVPVKRVRHSIPKKFTNSRRLFMEATFGTRAAFSKWDQPDVLKCVTPALDSTALVCLKNRAIGRHRPALGVWVQDLYTVGLAETQTVGSAVSSFVGQLESWVLRQADGIAVIHDRFRTQLLDNLHVSPAKVRTVRNWVHISSDARSDRDADREQFGWAPDEVVVLHAGAMGVKQGLENVVRAAQIADEKESKIRFVLLGDGNQRRSLEAMGRGTRRMEIREPLPDDKFTSALIAADILLVNQKPGVAEMSIPSKLTSYFQSGTPVLAAIDARSNAAEELRNSGGGIVVESGDPVLLLDAATALAADPELRNRLGANGREYVTRVLSAQNSLDNFDEWVQQLSASRRG